MSAHQKHYSLVWYKPSKIILSQIGDEMSFHSGDVHTLLLWKGALTRRLLSFMKITSSCVSCRRALCRVGNPYRELESSQTSRRRVVTQFVGRLRSYGGNCNENVTCIEIGLRVSLRAWRCFHVDHENKINLLKQILFM